MVGLGSTSPVMFCHFVGMLARWEDVLRGSVKARVWPVSETKIVVMQAYSMADLLMLSAFGLQYAEEGKGIRR